MAYTTIDPRVFEVLDVYPEQGIIRWKVDRGKRKAGDLAGSLWKSYKQKDCEYWRVDLKFGPERFRLGAYQIIFFYVHGYLPKVIDHIDGVSTNDCIDNLRPCNHSQNSANSRKRKSASKYRGVYYEKRGNKWVARITHKLQHIHIGTFDTEELAAKAYNAKALECFGDFATLNHLLDDTPT